MPAGWERHEYLREHVKSFIEIHEDFVGKWKPTRDELVWMSEFAMNSGPLWNTLGPSLLCLRGLATDEQQGWWLQRTIKMEIIVSYAQTELGHGSNVRGLRTEAVYDRATEEFVLNTPDLESMKWWPGAMGKVATHALVYAQLIIDGKQHGLQTFMVQIRDENHRFLPGIEAGDLGPKMGDHATDTSFMRLHGVRIPRKHMLARHGEVTKDGRFAKAPGSNSKLHYVSMLFTRGNLIRQAGGALARAACIATRYSCVRQQGFVDSKSSLFESEERTIIEYQMQQHRVLKQIAMSYAIKFVGRYMLNRFHAMEGGDASGAIKVPPDLNEIAATSAGLKGVCTAIAASGIEDCRQCCGGNGYLLSSGIGALFGDYVWWVTAEGDTVVMQLQLARFLVKSVDQAQSGQVLPTQLSYLAPVSTPGFDLDRRQVLGATKEADFTDLSKLRTRYSHRALVAVVEVAEDLKRLKASGMSHDEAWNSCMVELCHAAQCHVAHLLLDKFADAAEACQDPS